MLSVKDVREFLELGWFHALVGLIAGTATLTLDYYKVPYFSGAPSWVLVAAACLTIACGAIILAHFIKLPIAGWQMWNRAKNAQRLKNIILNNLIQANEVEKNVLSYYFSTNERVFHAPFDQPIINSLKAKRLISQLPGTHSILEWPFSFADVVWEEMTRDPEKWTMRDAQSRRPPFTRW